MSGILRTSKALGLSLVFCWTVDVADAKICNGNWSSWGPSGRTLYLQRTPVPQTGFQVRRTTGSVQFSYIVPGTQFTSGVLIAKTAHRLASDQPNTTALVKMTRENYKSPCSQKRSAGEVPAMTSDFDVKTYRNFHRYRRPDQSVRSLHADLGNRPSNYWTNSDGRCASTADWDIAPHFLFDEGIGERQPIGLGEYVVARGRTFGRAISPTAVAEELPPPVYSRFHAHSVLLLPYRKESQVMQCVTFSVAVPNNAAESTIMIIEADDARWPRPNPESADPQRVWQIRWSDR